MSRILSKKIHIDEEVSFGEFFSSGRDETISPFLTSSSRRWGKNLPLRVSIFAAVLLALAFVCMLLQQEAISRILQVMIFFLVGTPALIEAIKEVVSARVNIDVLMVLAAFMSIFIHSSLEGCLLLVLFSISSAMEAYVSAKAKSTLSHLSQMAPKSAQVIEGNRTLEKSIKDIHLNELILVRQGEMVPLDGIVIDGVSSLDTAHLTGEKHPINVKEGAEIASGSMNLEGSLTLKVTKTSKQSTMAKIIQMVCDAQDAKPKLQSWFDRFGQTYSLCIIGISLLVALVLPLFFSQISYGATTGSIYRALAFLIAASPCALIIAVPIAYISSINASAKEGALLKGGLVIDMLSKVKAIAFDKTGTLTSGDLECVSITDLEGRLIKDLQSILSVVRALEQHAVHPIAKALVSLAKFHRAEPCAIENCKAIPGQGIEGTALIEGQKKLVAIGNLDYIASKMNKTKQALFEKFTEDEKRMITFTLIDQEVFVMQFVDHLRPDATNVLHQLKEQLNLKTYILSGDRSENVERIAKNLHIDHYYSHLKPEDKLRIVQDLSKTGGLAMVGDGINDAPALACATVGISMGQYANNMAHKASDVVLMNNDLTLIEKLVLRAKKTIRIVKQNVALASLIILGVSIPAIFGFIPLWLAVVCHEGGTVLVGLNSLRLLRRSLR